MTFSSNWIFFFIHPTTGCPEPPKGDFVTSKVEFSYVKGSHVTGTRIKYTCDGDHGLKWAEKDLLTCGSDGRWDPKDAPQCGPSFCFVYYKVTGDF